MQIVIRVELLSDSQGICFPDEASDCQYLWTDRDLVAAVLVFAACLYRVPRLGSQLANNHDWLS